MAHRRNEDPKPTSSALMHIYNKDDELRRYVLITDYVAFSDLIIQCDSFNILPIYLLNYYAPIYMCFTNSFYSHSHTYVKSINW